MRRTRDEAEMTRKTILKESLGVFQKHGYSAATLEEIAGKAGITRGAIYWHFKNKADVLDTLIKESFSLIDDKLKTAVKSENSPIKKIKKIIRTYLVTVEENKEFAAILDLLYFKLEMVPELQYQMAAKKKVNKKRIRTMEHCVIQAQVQKQIIKTVKANTIALGIIGLMDGLISQWLLDSSNLSLTKQADEFIRLIFQGICNSN